MDNLLTLPLFLPALAAWCLIALAIGGAAGRWLGVSRAHAGALVVSLGIVVSATLTPQWAALQDGATGPATCDLSRTWLAPLRVYLGPGDAGANVLMFLPLGLALGLMPRSRARMVLLAAAMLLPVAVEATQLLLPFLDRACESRDVVDNLAGLVTGTVVGLGAGRLAGMRHLVT